MTASTSKRRAVQRYALLVLGLTAAHSGALQAQTPIDAGSPMQFERIDASQYRAFVSNWSGPSRQIHCAVIQNPAQWNANFSAAPVMNSSSQKFSPPDSFYASQQIFLLAKITPGVPENLELLHADSVTLKGDAIIVSYAYQVPNTPSTYTQQSDLLIAVQNSDVHAQHVDFIENGQLACTAQIAH